VCAFNRCVVSVTRLTPVTMPTAKRHKWGNRDSSVVQLQGCGLDVPRFESRQGLGIFLFTTASRPALGLTQPPIQGVPGALSLGIKRPGREADHSHLVPRSRMRGVVPPPPIRLHGVVLS
jgi:hypothetical protein